MKLQNGDYTMTILLSAIAVETLLSVYALIGLLLSICREMLCLESLNCVESFILWGLKSS